MMCDCPSFAAAPTHPRPTMKRICVRTKSQSPSSFLKTALLASTCSSALRSSADRLVLSLSNLSYLRNLGDGFIVSSFTQSNLQRIIPRIREDRPEHEPHTNALRET